MLTRRMKDTLEFLESYSLQHGVMPSYDEIASGLGLASKSGVHGLLVRLEERGYIERMPDKSRAIRLTSTAKCQGKTKEELQDEVDHLREELIRVVRERNFLKSLKLRGEVDA